MSEYTETHVYDRAAVAGADDAPGRILARIPPGSNVLDVGTGSGALGRALSLKKSCTIDGLTYNPEELAVARPHYRHLHLLDLEQEKASEVFASESYDRIVCADVLEHLRNADAVLADLARLLKPDGRILVSVPNTAYLGVVTCLIAGHLTRTREGLLDATHIRFFDRIALDELAQTAELRIVALERVIRNPGDTEFRLLDFDALPPAVLHYLQTLPDALTYEFVIELARPADDTSSPLPRSVTELPAYVTPEITPSFMSKAFFDIGRGYSEQDSACDFGRLGGQRTCLGFPLPSQGNAALSGLMIDLADRPGTFELFSLRIENSSGNTLWQWPGDWVTSPVLRDLDILPMPGSSGGCLLLARSKQPRMQLTFSPPLPLAARLFVDMTGPLQYEATAFHRAHQQTVESLDKQHKVYESRQEALQLAYATSQTALEQSYEGQRNLYQRLHSSAEENLSLHRLLQSSAEENLSLHRLLQSSAGEKQTLIDALKTAESVAGQQHEKISQLETIAASPLGSLRRWLALKIHRNHHDQRD